MDVIDRHMPFDDFCAFPFADLSDPVPNLVPNFSSENSKTIFGAKNHIVIAEICRMCSLFILIRGVPPFTLR